MNDEFLQAWDTISNHCSKHGLADVLLKVRDGYSEELSNERRCRHEAQVAAERVVKPDRSVITEKQASMTKSQNLAGDVRDALQVLNERIRAAEEQGLNVEISQTSIGYQSTGDSSSSRRTTLTVEITQRL